MPIHDLFMRRCFDLARRGASFVSLNYLAGAVIVDKGRIIGEAYSSSIKSTDAVIAAIQAVRQENTYLLKTSTLYLSQEPSGSVEDISSAVHQIVKQGIYKVIISCLNTTRPKGQGIDALGQAGIIVKTGVLEEEGLALNRVQQTAISLRRPYVILKYACSADGFIGVPGQQVWLSHPLVKRLTHKWRSEAGAIIIGTNTAETDNPRLNTRLYCGPSPTRIVLDRRGRLSPDLNIFDGKHPTWIIQEPSAPPHQAPNSRLISLDYDQELLPNLLKELYAANINSLDRRRWCSID